MKPRERKVVKGYASNPNEDPVYHVVEPLPEVTVRGIDKRGEKYAREGINQFARDYMIPVVNTIAAFSPMAVPYAVGQVAGAYTGNTTDEEKKDALINAGLELVPTGLSLLGKGASKAIKTLRKPKSLNNLSDYTAHSMFDKRNAAYSSSSAEVPNTNLFNHVGDINTTVGKIYKYNDDINKVLWDAYSDPYTRSYVKSLDKDFGTNYLESYKKLIGKDRSARSNIIKWLPKKRKQYIHEFSELPQGKDGRISLREGVNVEPGQKPKLSDYKVTIDPSEPYNGRLANHEYSHLVDADNLPTGNLQKETNPYLEWLMDRSNRNTMGEAYKEINYDWNISGKHYGQFTRIPTELKSYMLGFKRHLVNEGALKDILEPVENEQKLKNLFYNHGTSYEKDLYHSYRNKKNLLQRFNNLVPLSIIPALMYPSNSQELSSIEKLNSLNEKTNAGK